MCTHQGTGAESGDSVLQVLLPPGTTCMRLALVLSDTELVDAHLVVVSNSSAPGHEQPAGAVLRCQSSPTLDSVLGKPSHHHGSIVHMLNVDGSEWLSSKRSHRVGALGQEPEYPPASAAAGEEDAKSFRSVYFYLFSVRMTVPGDERIPPDIGPASPKHWAAWRENSTGGLLDTRAQCCGLFGVSP
jgi:hypothetical protein